MREKFVDTTPKTIKQLQTELQGLGVSTGDTLMVHASLRGVGPVEDRGQG